MVKFILLSVFCVLLVANKGICDDRITISQLLSFLDRIAVNFKQIRKSIPTPNNLKTFKFQNVYETPSARDRFDTLPQSIKDLFKPLNPGTTTTTTSTPSPSDSTSSGSTSVSSSTSSPSEAPPTPTTPLPTTSVPSSSTTVPPNPPTESSAMTSKSTTSSSSTDATVTTDSPTSSPATLPTPAPTSSIETPTSTGSTSTAGTTPPPDITTIPTITNSPPETRNIVKNNENTENFNIDTSNLVEWFRKSEEADRQKPKFLVRRNKTDQDKITEVLNDVTWLANKWGLGFAVYKMKLQIFEAILVNGFPSNILERVKADLLAKPVQIARPFIVQRINGIITKAKKYRTEVQDTQTLDNIIVLLEAAAKLPDYLIKSLTG